MKARKLISVITAAILSLSCVNAFSEAVSAEDDSGKIRAVQLELVALQLLPEEEANGVWGESTIEGIMRFQRFVNNVQGDGTLVENGECDEPTAGYLEFAAGKGWNVGAQVSADDVFTPAELEAIAIAEAEAKAAEEEAYRQKLENDKATIAYVQTMLRQLGLLDEVTGEFDDATKEAIMIAQRYINKQMESEVVEVNGAYDDTETLIYLNTAAEKGWIIPRVEETPEPVIDEPVDGESSETGEAAAKPTPAPREGVSAIEDFVLTIDGEEKNEPFSIAPGKHDIAWSAKGVSMFSMYLYDGDGTLLNKNEAMPMNYFTLDTFGMSSGVVYEIRIGAVPNGGQVEDMQWRSLFLTLS